MKKILASIMAVLMVGALASCGDSEKDSEKDKDKDEQEVTEEVTEEPAEKEKPTKPQKEKPTKASDDEEKPTKPAKDDEVLIEYDGIKILGYEMGKDDSKNDMIVLNVEWTNTTDEEEDFAWNYDLGVYQHGIECYDADYYDPDEPYEYTNVAPGETLEFKMRCIVEDDSALSIIIYDESGYEDELIVNESIDLGGAPAYEIPKKSELDDTYMKYIDYSLDKDEHGEDVIIINYEFYNGENEPTPMRGLYQRCNAFQNGIALCDAYYIDDYDYNAYLRNILPGVTYKVSMAYLLDDDTDVTALVKFYDFYKVDDIDETIKMSGGAGVKVPDKADKETSVKVVSSKLVKDFLDEDSLLIELEFYNGSDEPKSLRYDMKIEATQDGETAFETYILADEYDDVDLWAGDRKIMPGITYHAYIAYDVDVTKDFVLNVKEYFDNQTVYIDNQTIELK